MESVVISSENNGGQLAIYRQLQKNFRYLRQILDKMAADQRSIAAVSDSLANQAEQLQCCDKVQIESTPLACFTDLKSRLKSKIAHNMKEEIKPLHDSLQQMEAACTHLDHLINVTFDLYRRYPDQLSVSCIQRGQPLWPSLVMMLQWLEDINNQLFTLYCEREYILSRVDFASPDNVAGLTKKWKQDRNLSKNVTDMLTLLQFFMMEKF